MRNESLTMLLRTSDKFNGWLDFLLPQLDLDQTLLGYSMFRGYVLPEVCHALEPHTAIIPIQRDEDSDFSMLDIGRGLRAKIAKTP